MSPTASPDTTLGARTWKLPRREMAVAEKIVERMADDIVDLGRGDEAVEDFHLVGLGWTYKQITLYGDRAVAKAKASDHAATAQARAA